MSDIAWIVIAIVACWALGFMAGDTWAGIRAMRVKRHDWLLAKNCEEHATERRARA